MACVCFHSKFIYLFLLCVLCIDDLSYNMFLIRAEASAVRSSELHSPVMDLPTFEALSLSDPSLSTPETAEMTNVDYAPRSE